MSKHNITITVNGQQYSREVPAHRMLSEFLRDDLNLTGTKRGCESGTCGACSILLDGDVVKSCLYLAIQVDGRIITTIEGLAQGDQLHPIQESFLNCGGLQCGYCTPGMIMATKHLLDKNPHPNEQQVRDALNGNLCRCTGYSQIVESVLDASEKLNGN